MRQKKELTLKLLRNLLGSIDLENLEEKEMAETERQNYSAAIFAVFPRLEKDIKNFLHKQLIFSSNQAENWEQVIFSRGTFNGISLLLEHWIRAKNEYLEKLSEKERVADIISG